jgi:hypothetical protein
VVDTTLVTTEYSGLINTATDQNRPLEDAHIEIESIKSIAYATKVAKNLSTAVKNMCPSCVELVQKALTEEEATVEQRVMKGGFT